jgi:uncharacterized lipoprotein YbaY
MPLLLSACAATGTGPGGGLDAGVAAGAAAARDNAAEAQATADSLPKPAPLVMMGSLGYRARIALPPQAVARVELREFPAAAPDAAPAARPAGTTGRVVAQQTIELGGRQVPVPFSAWVERGTLSPASRYELRGGILVDGRPAWVSAPVQIDITTDRIDTGLLMMQPYGGEPFAMPPVAP